MLIILFRRPERLGWWFSARWSCRSASRSWWMVRHRRLSANVMSPFGLSGCGDEGIFQFALQSLPCLLCVAVTDHLKDRCVPGDVGSGVIGRMVGKWLFHTVSCHLVMGMWGGGPSFSTALRRVVVP